MKDIILIEASSKSTYQRKYKCPYCEQKFERTKLHIHIQNKHEELIPEGYTALRVAFNTINNKTEGHCIMCGKVSDWNEDKGRYERLCNDPKCHEAYKRMAAERNKKKYGTERLQSDPRYAEEVQRKALQGRRIAGKYKFSDGGEIDYLGAYERRLLEFMDKVMKCKSEDIAAPGPTIKYMYQDKEHLYISDFYYIPYNLIIEVKDGGDNPNTNPALRGYKTERQQAKEAAVKATGKYNYIRLTNNDFGQLMSIMAVLKYNLQNECYDPIMRINEMVLIEQLESKLSLSKFLRDNSIDDVYELYDWMHKNIKYKSTGKYQSPEETIKRLSGDCHDQAELAYRCLMKLGYQVGKVFMVEYYDYEKPGGRTHTLTYFLSNNNYYWFENAWGNKAGIHKLKGKQFVEILKPVFEAWDWSGKCDKLYWTPFRANPKYGCDLGEYVGLLTPEKEPKKNIYYKDKSLNESILFSEKDIYYNKDKFDSGEINLCFITGHSGSGKSTMARDMQKNNVEHYELDDLQCIKDHFTMSQLKEYGDLIYSYFNGPGKKFYMTYQELVDNKIPGSEYEDKLFPGFVHYSMQYAKSHKDRKYVIEGVWLFCNDDNGSPWFKPEEFKDYAFYIKGTSMIVSKWRAAKRDAEDNDNSFDRLRYSSKNFFFNNWKWYFIDEKQINRFRNYFKKILVNESVSLYNSDSDINYNQLSKYKMIIVGEIHNNRMINMYRKLLSAYKFDYLIAEFADIDRSFTREELKQKMDNATNGLYNYDPSRPCDYQYNYWIYKLAYDFDIPLIGCNPVNKKYKNMNDEDKNREAYMLSVIKEFESKGRCLVQLGDHHLRSIPITKEFLEYCNDTTDDRGIYKNIDDLIVENSSPIWDEYNNKPNILLLRVKSEYDNEINFMKNINESLLYESDDASKLDKNFKHKSGIEFDIVDIRDKKVKGNIDEIKGKYKDYFKGFAAFEKGTDNFAGFIRIWPDWVLEEKYHGNLISPVEVKSKYRGYGLGRLLVEKSMEKFNANMLMVAKDNEVAINMYKKLGFSISQNTKWKNEDYYIMTTNTVKLLKSTNKITEDMSGTIGAALAPTTKGANIIKPLPVPTPYESDPDHYLVINTRPDQKLSYSITRDPLQYTLYSVDPQEKGFYKVFKSDKGKISKNYLTFKIKDKKKAKELYENLTELYKRNLTFMDHGLSSDVNENYIYSYLTDGNNIITPDQILFDNRFELVRSFEESVNYESSKIYNYLLNGYSIEDELNILSEQVKELEEDINE